MLRFNIRPDRQPLPLSVIVSLAELWLLLTDLDRRERDNERDCGLGLYKAENKDEVSEVEAAFASSRVLTNLSSSAKSASLFQVRFAELLVGAFAGSTSHKER